MSFLTQIILKYVKIEECDFLKVINFLNHQLNVNKISRTADEVNVCFWGYEVTKILTIRCVGISVVAGISEMESKLGLLSLIGRYAFGR